MEFYEVHDDCDKAFYEAQDQLHYSAVYTAHMASYYLNNLDDNDAWRFLNQLRAAVDDFLASQSACERAYEVWREAKGFKPTDSA